MKSITVTYEPNEEPEQSLKELTEIYNTAMGTDRTEEKVFDSMMLIGSNARIRERIEFFKAIYSEGD